MNCVSSPAAKSSLHLLLSTLVMKLGVRNDLLQLALDRVRVSLMLDPRYL